MKRKPIARIEKIVESSTIPGFTTYARDPYHLYRILCGLQDTWWTMSGRYRDWGIDPLITRITVTSLVDGSVMCAGAQPFETPVYKSWDMPTWKFWQGWTFKS